MKAHQLLLEPLSPVIESVRSVQRPVDMTGGGRWREGQLVSGVTYNRKVLRIV